MQFVFENEFFKKNGNMAYCILTEKGVREREMFYLTMHSTHFIYSYMASDIW